MFYYFAVIGLLKCLQNEILSNIFLIALERSVKMILQLLWTLAEVVYLPSLSRYSTLLDVQITQPLTSYLIMSVY